MNPAKNTHNVKEEINILKSQHNLSEGQTSKKIIGLTAIIHPKSLATEEEGVSREKKTTTHVTTACKEWHSSGKGNTDIVNQVEERAIMRWTPTKRVGQKRPLEERPESEVDSEDDAELGERRPGGVNSAD